MSQKQEERGKAMKVFRLETEAVVSVLDLDKRVHIGPVDFISLSNENWLRSAFESAGLTPEQADYALWELARTENNKGFLIPIDQKQPTK